ncbi:MAG: leucyl/phenylalanyl-tRNA--protein transferase [Acidimicrobiia bacterium]|nr:leucyl/phenylalanyl-tRNA--protein transferase [Acidimicrobiia bacterium]
MPPIEPPPCVWALPDPSAADADGVCGVGADLEPGTLLAAYRRGLFPMHLDRRGRTIGWWSPDPRGVLPIEGFAPSRSVRRARSRFDVRVDTAFGEVIAACARPRPTGGHWIHPAVIRAYTELHRLRWAHSVETWDPDTGRLVGGLYGVAIGGLFAGESMFHVATDASKVALAALVERLDPGGLLDVQWATPHLRSLGAVALPAQLYLSLLPETLTRPLPPAFA